MKGISSQRGLIERFERDQASLDKARLAMDKARKDVNALKLALRANPEDAGAAKALEKARQQSDKLSVALEKQRDKLRRSREAMSRAGVQVGDYAREYTRLGQALDQARGRHDRLEKAMVGKSQAAARLGELRGQLLGFAGAVYGSARLISRAADFDYELRLFGNVADLDAAELAAVRTELNGIGGAVMQQPGKLLEGLNTLTAKGLDIGLARASIDTIGRTATASGAEINDLAGTAYTLIDAMGLSPKELPMAMDMLAQAGKMGSFELRDMAQYFPALTAQAKSLGLVGREGVATLGAALQVAMKGASDPSQAANNFQNFLGKLTAPETVKRFEEFGVNIEEAMKESLAAGKNPIEEMVLLIQELTEGDKFRIGELFGDRQVIDFLTPMLQNLETFNQIKEESLAASGVVDKDFARMAETTRKKLDGLAIAVTRVGDAFGRSLAPGVNVALGPVTGMVGAAGELLEKYPAIGKLLVGSVAGLGAYATYVGAATAATWLLNAALLTNPIGWVVAAIVAAGALIAAFWDPIVEKVGKVWELMKKVGSVVGRFVGSSVDSVSNAIAAASGSPVPALAGHGALPPLMTSHGPVPVPSLASSHGARAQVNDNRTDNRRYEFRVYPSPGMNEQDLAEKVRRELDKRDQARAAERRGALYDHGD